MTKKTHIIGTKVLGHDQSYCYLRDGAIVYYCEEERFSRYKFGWGTSHHSLQYLIQKYGIDPETDTALFNLYDNPEIHKYERLVESSFYKNIDTTGTASIRQKAEVAMGYLLTESGLGFKNFEVTNNAEHHLLHAASGFFPSPFENAAILSIDGAGDGISTLIAEGQGNCITIKHKIPLPHSLGVFYNMITQWIGVGGLGDEGKTMGASSYGDPSKYYALFRDKIIDYDEDGIFILKITQQEELDTLLGDSLRSTPHSQITQKEFDIAATTQKITEEIILNLARFAKKITGQKYLCLAGGVALNSVSNGKLLQSGIFEDIWIQPAAGDAGLCIGGALWNYYVTQNHPRNSENGEKKWWIQEHTYWGPEFTNEEILEALKEFNLPVRKMENVEAWTAKKLFENKVVGWFQGKIEAGPRALGNRSILANPAHPQMQDIVNNKVKFREPWRPFAPSVLEEECGIYFDSDHPSPFMILVYNVRQEWKNKIPAITHVDGTARVQTVSSKTNPRYYHLISEFKKLSQIGMLLNTSFNVKGEPIVLTPRQAIIDFLRTGMDVLVLHDYVIEKSDLENFETDLFNKDFHPIEDNVRFLSPGKHILIDYTNPQTDFSALDTFLHYAGRRHNTFSILPIVSQKSDYHRLQKNLKNIIQIWDNLGTHGLNIPDLHSYQGLVCMLPVIPYRLGFSYSHTNIAVIQNLCDKFLAAHPQLKIWLLGPSGVLYDYDFFKKSTHQLKPCVENMLMEEKNLDITQSSFSPYIEDVKSRFPSIFKVNVQEPEHVPEKDKEAV